MYSSRQFESLEAEFTVAAFDIERNNVYVPESGILFNVAGKSVFNGISQTRVSFRVKNLTDKRYAQWGDPGYTDQVILGAPRSYEVAASFKW
jgi:iron complex outermembrane receptor protein